MQHLGKDNTYIYLFTKSCMLLVTVQYSWTCSLLCLWNTSGNKWHKVTQSDINTNNIKGILTFVLIHLIKPKKQYTGKYKQLQQ